MCVANAEAAENDPPHVRPSISIGVAQMHDLIEIANEHSAVPRLDALHHRQSVSKAPQFVGFTVAVRIFEHENVVSRVRARPRLRIGGRAGDEETAPFVPRKLRGLDHAVPLGGEEIHLVTFGQCERGEFFFRRHSLSFLGRTGLRRRSGRRHSFAACERMNPRISHVNEGTLPLEFLLQRGLRAAALAVWLRNAITIDKRPVCRPPTIKPEAILLDDGLAHRFDAGREISLHAEFLGDQAGYFVHSSFGQVYPVFRQAPG